MMTRVARRVMYNLAGGLFAFAATQAVTARPAAAQTPGLDSMFTRQEVRVPMRDGVKLFTVVLTPRHASGPLPLPLPILLSRTPYGTSDWGGTSGIETGFGELMRDGYIFVFQDIRGRHQSDGQYTMNRLPRDPRDPRGTDESTYQTGPLNSDVTVAGDVAAKIYASTTGTDADWIVKLIDVYPDSVKDRPAMGGYELMVASEIMRGRYRTDPAHPSAIPANAVVPYTFSLRQAAYTFKKGHRMMVQVQSTWFPLYNRNPQTFVPNIFHARATDFKAETHRIYHTASAPSQVVVSVLP